jgi:hypothetical protein
MRNYIKKITPVFLRTLYRKIERYCLLPKYASLKKQIISSLEAEQREQGLSSEKLEILDFLYSNKLSVFPYHFGEKYRKEDIVVSFDRQLRMYYALLFGNKRMYFNKKWSARRIVEYINGIKAEQDVNSPHCYLSDDFCVAEGCIVADIGAAEGFFSLSIIDSVKKIYLFEPDFEWREPLYATFKPWSEKVEIISKYVSDTTNSQTIRLDDFFLHKETPTFIKADIEGYESRLLEGAVNIINTSPKLHIALCTYHRQHDYEEFSALLAKKNFNTTHSPGYMIFYIDKDLSYPYLRRGLIRAWK